MVRSCRDSGSMAWSDVNWGIVDGADVLKASLGLEKAALREIEWVVSPNPCADYASKKGGDTKRVVAERG